MVKKNTTFLNINGRSYDATTGQLLRSEKPHQAPRPISDVVRVGKQPAMPPHLISKPAAKPTPVTSSATAKKSMDVRAPHHVAHHQPQHSKTLMRSAVSKPAAGLRHRIKAIGSTDVFAKTSTPVILPKASVGQIDKTRLAHAKHVAKSNLIQRFAPMGTPTFVTASATTAKLAVSGAHNVWAQRAQAAAIPGQKVMDVFEKALAHADAHEQPPVDHKKLARTARKQAKHAARANKKPLRQRTSTVVLASLIVLALTGFTAYQNRSNLLIRYASAKAGFNASLPSYKPAGFSMGTLKYTPDNVNIAFRNTTGQGFTLTQQASNWDSQTLLDNVVAGTNQTYQTVERKGQTIFIYNKNDATWVSGGIVYQLSGNGNLSTNQLVSIATSM